MHSRVNFSSRMSEGCRKITQGRQGREILVQTHEQRTYALTYALIRDALLYCQAGWRCTSRQLIPRLVC